MNLTQLKALFADKECSKVYVKILAANDNSKNQVYLGGSFEILNILPITNIVNEPAGDWNKERFKATINFAWLSDEGTLYPAPHSQLILYPKYPEVRFSGFLLGCEQPPSELMTQRLPGRLLFFSVSKTGQVIGYVAAPHSKVAAEFQQTSSILDHGVFKVIELPVIVNNKGALLAELCRIHQLGWIDSKRLDATGSIVLPCNSPQCGGYTLEAELGIPPNAYSKPDYLGWEIKQFGVSNFKNINSATITLITPEPTHGLYVSNGREAFIRKYGYEDRKGREDRMNVGGIHKIGTRQKLTDLQLDLIGFDIESGKIRSTDGRIALIDLAGNEAASWSFSEMLLHWNRKHNQACYIPSLKDKGLRRYRYSNRVILGTGTDFQLFLAEMAKGNIYYDPGIKMEKASTKPDIKNRSQFRIKSRYLSNLYKHNSIVDVCDPIE
jgi:hypothetical protein